MTSYLTCWVQREVLEWSYLRSSPTSPRVPRHGEHMVGEMVTKGQALSSRLHLQFWGKLYLQLCAL